MNINNLFPTPVGYLKREIEFTKNELNFVRGLERRDNQGNLSSVDSCVLKNSKLKNILSFIQISVDQYFDEVYKPKEDVRVYITQSWVNYTKPGQWHHKHEHPNSFISGVLYFNANPNKDKIYFYKNKYELIYNPPREWNLWNSDSWWYAVGTGGLILFPSSLSHRVEPVLEDDERDERISLSFNTFLTGYLGEDKHLTGLHL